MDVEALQPLGGETTEVARTEDEDVCPFERHDGSHSRPDLPFLLARVGGEVLGDADDLPHDELADDVAKGRSRHVREARACGEGRGTAGVQVGPCPAHLHPANGRALGEQLGCRLSEHHLAVLQQRSHLVARGIGIRLSQHGTIACDLPKLAHMSLAEG